jgi:hypothetical protein
MAENPIKKNEIADFDEIQKSINELIASLEKLSQVFHKDLKEAADAVAKSLQGVNVTTKEGQETVAKASATTADLFNQQKQLTSVDKQLADARAKLTVLEKEGVQGKIKETAEIKKSISEKQKEITQGKAAADSYTVLVRKLKELRDAWKLAGESGRKELTPQIQKIDKQLKDLDKTIGQHQRNVGNYGSAIAGVGKQLLSAVGVVGGVTLAVKGFNSIVNSAQILSDKFAIGIEGAKFGFDAFAKSIATMDFSNFFTNITEAVKMGIEYAKVLDELADRRNAVAIRESEARLEIAQLMKVVRDVTVSEQERIDSANKVLAIEDDLAAARVKNAEILFNKELEISAKKAKISEDELKNFLRTYDQTEEQRAAGQRLLDVEAKMQAAIKLKNQSMEQSPEYVQSLRDEIKAYSLELSSASEEQKLWAENIRSFNRLSDQQGGDIDKLKNAWIEYGNELASFDEKTARVESRRAAILQEQVVNEKKVTKELNKEQEERTRAVEQQAEARIKALDKEMQEQGGGAQAQITADAENTRFALKEIKQQEVEDTKEARLAEAEFIKEMNREILRDRIAAAEDSMQAISDASAAIGDIMAAQKQRELNAAGDNAEKREEIERKYFEREKKLAITQAIINGALAITKVQAQTGILSPFTIPLIIASTLGQIAVIAAQKFAKGGYTGDGSMRDETGERVAGIVHEKEFVIDKHNTKKYRPVLEAIHRDDPHGIATAINGQYYDIWDRANSSIEMRQDPYTQKMYELLANQPVIYTDSNGDTVLRFSTGRKQIIKKR